MTGPKSVSEMVHMSKDEIAEENDRATIFREKSSFICRHIYLHKQLLPQIKSCCQEVMQNNEMTSSCSNHCLMLVARCVRSEIRNFRPQGDGRSGP